MKRWETEADGRGTGKIALHPPCLVLGPVGWMEGTPWWCDIGDLIRLRKDEGSAATITTVKPSLSAASMFHVCVLVSRVRLFMTP